MPNRKNFGGILVSKKILVADDEKSIANIIAYNLKKENYEVCCAYDGQEAWNLFKQQKFDLVMLDVMMPGLSGFEICKKIRNISQVPVIFLTAKAEEIDKVEGFEIGADDYVTKPFGVNELVARVKAHLKRTKDPELNMVIAGKIKIDFARYEVFRNDTLIHLTPKEFDLIKFLVTHEGQIFSREELLKSVWEYEYSGDARTVDVTVRRLRMKIEESPDNPEIILTKRGVGYYFESRARNIKAAYKNNA